MVIVIYVWSYYRGPTDIEIHQTTLQDFQFDMLRAKQPLVLDDRIVNLEDIRRNWFSPNIVRDFRLDASDAWHTNRFKYLFMHAEQEGDIYMYPPGKKMIAGPENAVLVPDPQESLVAVHLLPGQALIVPFRWRYLIMQPMRVGCLGIHDYVTYMLP